MKVCEHHASRVPICTATFGREESLTAKRTQTLRIRSMAVWKTGAQLQEPMVRPRSDRSARSWIDSRSTPLRLVQRRTIQHLTTDGLSND